MRLLLDTHVVLWHFGDVRRLGPHAEQAIERASELRVSAVSFAEVGVKAAVGKLSVRGDLHAEVVRSGMRLLPLTPQHGLAVADLPLHHRDPFDRLLIAQPWPRA
ncbi:type II toxin-antitoxin system VapC family toxin [Geodermatophilus sp. DF01-2]|uniref:type II toxin-antitoxin system VapC family toxin n=1 Tax=Geodermatophilus sp. DF01-2 TaxID=2559610 RepID=UPI001ADD6CCF|nr:type II toxin-antitoxin system VapC family toxin [Geodermatophilus sp. DF01_2]